MKAFAATVNMVAHGEHSQRGDEPITISFEEAIRELRHRPRNAWLELARIDQFGRWRSGAGVLAEEYFAQLPELRADDEESMIFICGEMQLRSALGAVPNLEEYQHRFPELSDQLAIQFSVNKVFDKWEPGNLEQIESEVVEIDLGLKSVGYELLKEIGRGASGIVYKAQQLSLNRLVAVKVLENPGSDPKRSLRQRQEAELLARLRHPNVVHVYEVLNHRRYVVLVMELIEGPTLRERIDGRPWQSRDAGDLAMTLADTVHAVHEAGILHRDLKPSNVLLTPEGHPKISDFGLAKLRADDNFLTTQDSVLGTPSYMSPEQAIGDLAKIGPATDVYSLGAILYELLVGRPPFLGGTVIDTLSMIREREPVAPRYLQPGTPRDLETICLKCLQKNPQSRYLSALDLADDLRRFLKGDAIVAREPSFVERLGRSIRRNKVAYSAGLAVFVALVSGLCMATWGLIREQSARQRAEIAFNRAEEAARKSQQVAAFLKDILHGVDPSVALG
ncbi:MAG TPA: serine/threonine-protein kinase, partial [Lacipirellulaceae bacterium]|nr:serine/threonine-protein kinase [Lacipirellulaceae bacterium]